MIISAAIPPAAMDNDAKIDILAIIKPYTIANKDTAPGFLILYNIIAIMKLKNGALITPRENGSIS